MPRSVFILFISKYPDHNQLNVGDEVTCRIKHFRYVPKRFAIVDIEESTEDGEVIYVYYGTYLGEAK